MQYTVSAVAKTEWYNSIKLSMEYTDASGERHYSNLQAQTSNGDWATFSGIKFSFSEDVSKVYLYFECNDTATMYIDDFEVRTAPVYQIQKDIPSLKDVYANDFKIGTAVTTEELAPQSTKDLIAKHFNSITLGNELKPESILDKSATQASGSETEPVINPGKRQNHPELLPGQQYPGTWPRSGMAQPDTGLVLQGRASRTAATGSPRISCSSVWKTTSRTFSLHWKKSTRP